MISMPLGTNTIAIQMLAMKIVSRILDNILAMD